MLLLLERGADAGIRDSFGQAPLYTYLDELSLSLGLYETGTYTGRPPTPTKT